MVYSFSNKGGRTSNQDFLFSKSINSDCNLYMVVDGMGGYEFGDIASELVAENIYTYLSTVKEINEKEIQKAVNKSNLVIKQKSHDFGAKIGATLAGIIVVGNLAYLFWVGDVKIILIRNNEILFETRSHTLINQMIENGNLINNIDRYKHVVTRSISGKIKDGIIECYSSDLLKDDLMIIYSDGVSDILGSYQINHIFKSSDSVYEGLNKVEATCNIDAKDNFSMSIIQI